MSFGFAVGDAIAILNLFERVALEVRNHRNAPQHFQQLGAELQLLQRALQRLLQMEPDDDEEVRQLEQIRAIAIHCYQPVQAFINKMRPVGENLGHARSSTTLRTIGRRLHWSLVTKNDVDELRKVVMSEMIAINMLLAVQQLRASLKKLKDDADSTKARNVRQFHAEFQTFFVAARHMLRNANVIPTELGRLQNIMEEHNSKQTEVSTQFLGRFDTISASSGKLIKQSRSTSKRIGDLGSKAARCISILKTLSKEISHIFRKLQTYSRDVMEAVAINGRRLLDIHQMMKRLVKAVEAIPLHLTLAIVRLDDALGESWALPYQACQHFWSFEDLIRGLIFEKNRPGARLVRTGQFVLRSAESGKVITHSTLSSIVKEGAHVMQSIILFNVKDDVRRCLSGDCGKTLQNDSENCSARGRSSSLETQISPLLRPTTWDKDLISCIAKMKNKPFRTVLSPLLPYRSDEKDDDIRAFRNVHVFEREAPIQSLTEADKGLQDDPLNASALQFLGCHLLQSRTQNKNHIEYDISLLRKSVVSDSCQLETHYLFGRAYSELRSTNLYDKCYQAYHKAIRFDPCCDFHWLSLGMIYFLSRQYEKCLDALTKSSQPALYSPLIARNVAFLYDYWFYHDKDVIAEFSRLTGCILNDRACEDRLMAMIEYRFNVTYDARELDQDGPVEVAGLRLDKDDKINDRDDPGAWITDGAEDRYSEDKADDQGNILREVY